VTVSDAVRVGTWRLLVQSGHTIDDVVGVTGHSPQEVFDAVTGTTYELLPGPLDGRRPPEPELHRRRLLLRTLLDASDRTAGPRGCWPSIGWTQQGRPARHSALLGTSSKARAVLMLTSADPVTDQVVAAHTCGNGSRSDTGQEGCVTPAHLVAVERKINADHRRLHRLGLPVARRSETDMSNLDVLARPLVDLRLLAQLEKELTRAAFTDDGQGCLLKAGTSPQWYGHVRSEGHPQARHRWLLELCGLEVQGWVIEHSCLRRKGCFAIAHLHRSTPSLNALHAAEDGLTPTGEDHPRSRYRNAEVEAVRRNRDLGLPELQRRYGGTQGALRDILSGKSYKHVGGALVAIPAKRRLSHLGVQIVRTLRACGAFEELLVTRFELSPPYLRKLVAGEVRGAARGPLTAPPGPATGRRVHTAKLSDVDRRLIAERLAAGHSCRAIAAELQLHPSTVERAQPGPARR